MYKKINQGLLAATLLFTVFATSCNNEGDKTESADTTVIVPVPVPAPADTTIIKDTTIIDTSGVQKPVIKTN
jgi:hypothetical protein